MSGHRDTHPWLRPGDVVELDVEHIGVLRNTIAARP
jgi:fumarylacetoacetate (FAA) hydrolase